MKNNVLEVEALELRTLLALGDGGDDVCEQYHWHTDLSSDGVDNCELDEFLTSENQELFRGSREVENPTDRRSDTLVKDEKLTSLVSESLVGVSEEDSVVLSKSAVIEEDVDFSEEDDLPKPLDPSLVDRRQHADAVEMQESAFWQMYHWMVSFFVSEE